MSLASGSQLGPYEIVAAIGAGGMGEVYRARDTKLNREVAIKVLPAELAQDHERVVRFRREAQVLAALNHPNIAAIHGLEEANGSVALVMELVEGEDIAERLKRGPIPPDEALAIARQVAEALEEAHEHGIIHRDLKPANIKVTPDGKVKVLDFGLAKAFDREAGASSGASQLSHSPTMSRHMTEAGMILGTAAYMSPEQARGKPLDKRTDIWAFGVVFFEMLAGERLFAGETVSDVLAAVLTREPDWKSLPPGAGPVRDVLERCLERDPKKRIRDAGDVRQELERSAARPATTGDRVFPAGGRPARGAWIAALLAAVILGGVATWLIRPRAAGGGSSLHLSIQLPPELRLAISSNASFTFSPDSKQLVVVATEDGRRALYRRNLESGEISRIEGTEGGSAPSFSPDGRWLSFISGGRQRRVAVEGGRPLDIAAQQGAGGATFLPDGDLILAPAYTEGLFRVSPEGPAPRRLTTPDRANGELGHWWPQLIPGGDVVLFTAFRTPVDTSKIRALSLSTGEVHDAVDGGFFARYVPGYLLYAKSGRLYAAPFDPKRAVVTGPARVVLEDVYASTTGGYALFDVSADGTLAYVPASLADVPRELVWLDRDGRIEKATDEARRYLDVSLSPDGRTAAMTILGDSLDLWTLDLERRTLSRLTSGLGTEFGPVWARDGASVLFVFDRPPFDIHEIAFGATAEARPLWKEASTFDTNVSSVSPDGRFIGYRTSEPGTGSNVWVRRADGSEPGRPLHATKAEEEFPTFSPDGQWLAYQSDETGRPEIYAEAFPGPGERHQISRDGGEEPLWARNGDLFYRHDADMRVVATRRGARLEFDPPKTIFTLPPFGGIDADRIYDVTADGKRVIVLRMPEATAPRRIEIVTHWASQLSGLMAGAR